MNYNDKRWSYKENLLQRAIDHSLPNPDPCPISWRLLSVRVTQSWIRLTWILFQNSHCPEVLFQAEKLEDTVLFSFLVWIYWSWVTYLISVSPGWQKKTIITEVVWILLHLEEDTHKACGFIRSLVGPQDRLSNTFP